MEPLKVSTANVIWITGIFLVIVVLAIIAWIFLERSSEQTLKESSAGTAFQAQEVGGYTDLSGNTIDLEQYLGQVIVASAWASWSPFSQTELPKLARLQREFADQNVIVLAINRGEPRTTAEAYLRSVSAYDDVTLILDEDDRFYDSIGGFAMPETVFFDTRGNIVHQARGEVSYEQLKSFISSTLETATE